MVTQNLGFLYFVYAGVSRILQLGHPRYKIVGELQETLKTNGKGDRLHRFMSMVSFKSLKLSIDSWAWYLLTIILI